MSLNVSVFTIAVVSITALFVVSKVALEGGKNEQNITSQTPHVSSLSSREHSATIWHPDFDQSGKSIEKNVSSSDQEADAISTTNTPEILTVSVENDTLNTTDDAEDLDNLAYYADADVGQVEDTDEHDDEPTSVRPTVDPKTSEGTMNPSSPVPVMESEAEMGSVTENMLEYDAVTVSLKSESGSTVESETGIPVESETGIQVESETGIQVESETVNPVESETGIPMESETGNSVESETGNPVESENPLQREIESPFPPETENVSQRETTEEVAVDYLISPEPDDSQEEHYTNSSTPYPEISITTTDAETINRTYTTEVSDSSSSSSESPFRVEDEATEYETTTQFDSEYIQSPQSEDSSEVQSDEITTSSPGSNKNDERLQETGWDSIFTVVMVCLFLGFVVGLASSYYLVRRQMSQGSIIPLSYRNPNYNESTEQNECSDGSTR